MKKSKEENEIVEELESVENAARNASENISAFGLEALNSKQLREAQRQCFLAARDATIAGVKLYLFIRLAESEEDR